MISPIDINQPIEGILISNEQKRQAPILQIKIMEGIEAMIDTVLTINA